MVSDLRVLFTLLCRDLYLTSFDVFIYLVCVDDPLTPELGVYGVGGMQAVKADCLIRMQFNWSDGRVACGLGGG